ncbi:MAG TPA: DUF393 domain-containing protein [Pirellulales bacterium]|jgi:predicted DCC family thiol-disulfide oxidoreductase YuxK|nr:DUF393 domain-containing protein [Pirellulales bacterium]
MSIATPSTTDVPPASLGEQPTADVVIYDGHCRVCRGSMERLARLDRGRRLVFVSLHDPEVTRRWPDLRHDDLMQNIVVVDRRGQRHWGAAAFRYLSRRLPRLYWLAPLLHIPFSLPLWQRLYQMFARRRYLFGRAATCDDGSCRIN